jgi:hypothetical protein
MNESTVTHTSSGWLVEARRRLAGLGLGPEWPEESIAAPSDRASKSADCALRLLADLGLQPAHLSPSLEGGVRIAFSRPERYADIQFLNDGEVIATYSGKGASVPRVSPVDSDLPSTCQTLRTFLAG